MVYGYVDRSPGVVSYSPPIDEFGIDTGFIDVLFDSSTESKTIASDNFYLYKDNSYYKIQQAIDEPSSPAGWVDILGYKLPSGGNTNIQYIDESLGSNIVQLVSENNFDQGNPIYSDEILVREVKTPINKLIISPIKKTETFTFNTADQYSWTSLGLQLNVEKGNEIVGTMLWEDWQNLGGFDGTSSLVGITQTANEVDMNINNGEDLLYGETGQYTGTDAGIDKCNIGFTAQAESFNFEDQVAFWISKVTLYVGYGTLLDSNLSPWSTIVMNHIVGTEENGVGVSGNVYDASIVDPWTELSSLDNVIPAHSTSDVLIVRAYLNGHFNHQFAGNIYIDGVAKHEWGLIKNVLKQEYYANVNGRADAFYTGGSALMQIPCDIVYYLLREELGAGDIATDTTGLNLSREEHSGWKFGFTQNKKINSKKLLEGIMSSSKSLLRFKAHGEYDFITIRDFGSWDDHDITIMDDEIISMKYSKTKIEDVHTSVIVEYNKDYARDEYSSLPPINADGLFGEDSTSFYGLKSDHSESEKTFTTDYIRKETAAKLWQLFLLNWYCNQHLLIFLDLPLKYMNIEVGDIVCFNKASEVLPYGIDYGLDANQDFNTLQQVNHQDVYPQFLVYETNKQLDKVSVKCIQMHKIDNTYTAPESDDVEFNLEDTIAATNYDDTQQIIKGLLE